MHVGTELENNILSYKFIFNQILWNLSTRKANGSAQMFFIWIWDWVKNI